MKDQKTSINFEQLFDAEGIVWYKNNGVQLGKISIKKEGDQYSLFVEAERKEDPWHKLRLKGSKEFIIQKLQERLS